VRVERELEMESIREYVDDSLSSKSMSSGDGKSRNEENEENNEIQRVEIDFNANVKSSAPKIHDSEVNMQGFIRKDGDSRRECDNVVEKRMKLDGSSSINHSIRETDFESKLYSFVPKQYISKRDAKQSNKSAQTVLLNRIESHGFTGEKNETKLNQQKSILEPPKGTRKRSEMEVLSGKVPRTCIRTLKGHSKAVSTVSFFPEYGHLLMSTSLDGSIRVWNAEMEKSRRSSQCLRVFCDDIDVNVKRNNVAIRDGRFSPDGRVIGTAGYNGIVNIWDVESGQKLNRIVAAKSGRSANCVRFVSNGSESGNEMLVGCEDRRIVQFDLRLKQQENDAFDGCSDAVLVYESHQGSVNSVVFIDEGRKFVSSSEDRSLRVWEYGIPVVIKYIAEPEMYSMPITALHPNGKVMCCQSMNNEVVSYGIRESDRFRKNVKKCFRGHLVAGYACGLSFSPDGSILASADSIGRTFLWDWKTTKLLNCIPSHDKVCIDVDWHPTIPNLLATCSWDATIKLWQ